MSLKLLAVCIAVIIGGAVLLGYFYLSHWPDNNVHVVYCDVGQGDGVLITYHFTQVLIDSGPDSKILQCLHTYISSSDKNIEVIIATHPDKDHIGGFPAVFSQYTVSHLFVLGLAKDTQDFELFRQGVVQLLEKGSRVYLAHHSQQVVLSNIFTIKILFPEEKLGSLALFSREFSETQLSAYVAQQSVAEDSLNDASIATLLMVKKYTHLLTGDLEKNGEEALVDLGVLSQVFTLKAGHHGSNTSSIPAFLEKVRPEYVVVSSGKNNRYGHPHPQVLDSFHTLSSKIFRTDQQGHIEWISNGNTFQWKTQKNMLAN